MKKTIITFAAILTLGAASLLTSCAGNTMTGGNSTEKPTQSTTENITEKPTETNIIDEAESKLEDMSEEATHGVDDGSFGGHSSRGGDRTLFPKGK